MQEMLKAPAAPTPTRLCVHAIIHRDIRYWKYSKWQNILYTHKPQLLFPAHNPSNVPPSLPTVNVGDRDSKEEVGRCQLPIPGRFGLGDSCLRSGTIVRWVNHECKKSWVV